MNIRRRGRCDELLLLLVHVWHRRFRLLADWLSGDKVTQIWCTQSSQRASSLGGVY